MRWSDEFMGLIAAMFVFGAVVLTASGAPDYLFVGSLMVAGSMAVFMIFRTRRTPRVLVVGEPAGSPLNRLREELDDAGYGLRFCPGPDGRPCPVLEGRPCPVPGHPVAAVIVRPVGRIIPLPPCGEGLKVPVVTVRQESVDPEVTVAAVRSVA